MGLFVSGADRGVAALRMGVEARQLKMAECAALFRPTLVKRRYKKAWMAVSSAAMTGCLNANGPD
jgi:hypothetical protein